MESFSEDAECGVGTECQEGGNRGDTLKLLGDGALDQAVFLNQGIV